MRVPLISGCWSYFPRFEFHTSHARIHWPASTNNSSCARERCILHSMRQCIYIYATKKKTTTENWVSPNTTSSPSKKKTESFVTKINFEWRLLIIFIRIYDDGKINTMSSRRITSQTYGSFFNYLVFRFV